MLQYLLPLIILVAVAVAWWHIFRRIGWSPWWGLVMAVPLINLAAFVIFVVERWPIEARVRELEEEVARLRGGGSGTSYG